MQPRPLPQQLQDAIDGYSEEYPDLADRDWQRLLGGLRGFRNAWGSHIPDAEQWVGIYLSLVAEGIVPQRWEDVEGSPETPLLLRDLSDPEDARQAELVRIWAFPHRLSQLLGIPGGFIDDWLQGDPEYGPRVDAEIRRRLGLAPEDDPLAALHRHGALSNEELDWLYDEAYYLVPDPDAVQN
ncbi:hypothetical protein ACFP81_14960 [Deinococcus lacus]|uniref:DUF4375 domain-containing protein n=1 Tax=Deinococcus lacus TaxID=392561 RepID=A0ABW1YHW4_9DEIO